jgi:cobalt-precorrin 5A hydrolase
MRVAVVHIDHRPQAARLAELLQGDVLDYSDDVFERAFREYEGVVAIMAIGIVVRKVSTLIRDKWVDPAVVVVTPDLRFCVPVLGGHHGGNDIARALSDHGFEAVISTATDALGKDSAEGLAARNGLEVVNKTSTVAVNKAFLDGDVPFYKIDGPAVVMINEGVSVLAMKGEYVVGIGCNRGTSSEEIEHAVREALGASKIRTEEVLAYASSMKKSDEAGLITAIRELGGRMFFIDDETLNAQSVATRSKAQLIGLIGVAEPSALTLAKHKILVMERRAYGNVTVAIAR